MHQHKKTPNGKTKTVYRRIDRIDSKETEKKTLKERICANTEGVHTKATHTNTNP